MKTWLLSALAAWSLSGVAFAQEAAQAGPAVETVGVEMPVPPEAPGQVPPPPEEPEPPSQFGECITGVAPAGVRCRVAGVAMLGESAAGPITWSFYDVGSGQGRSALSVLQASGRVVSVPTPFHALERWKRDPGVVTSLIKRADAEYAVLAFPGEEGPAAFAVYKVTAAGLEPVNAAGLPGQVTAKLANVVGADCYIVSSDMNWRAFALRYDLMNDNGSCGTAHLDLGVESGAVVITGAMAVRDDDVDPTPRRRSRARRR